MVSRSRLSTTLRMARRSSLSSCSISANLFSMTLLQNRHISNGLLLNPFLTVFATKRYSAKGTSCHFPLSTKTPRTRRRSRHRRLEQPLLHLFSLGLPTLERRAFAPTPERGTDHTDHNQTQGGTPLPPHPGGCVPGPGWGVILISRSYSSSQCSRSISLRSR